MSTHTEKTGRCLTCRHWEQIGETISGHCAHDHVQLSCDYAPRDMNEDALFIDGDTHEVMETGFNYGCIHHESRYAK